MLLCCGADRAADTFIQKTKKVFQDTRSQRNMAALTADLAEVHTIMSKNIAEVLGQGEKLDSKWPAASFACRHRQFWVHSLHAVTVVRLQEQAWVSKGVRN